GARSSGALLRCAVAVLEGGVAGGMEVAVDARGGGIGGGEVVGRGRGEVHRAVGAEGSVHVARVDSDDEGGAARRGRNGRGAGGRGGWRWPLRLAAGASAVGRSWGAGAERCTVPWGPKDPSTSPAWTATTRVERLAAAGMGAGRGGSEARSMSARSSRSLPM